MKIEDLQFQIGEKLSDFRELHLENPSKFDRTFACLVRDMANILACADDQFDQTAFNAKCYRKE